MAAILALLASSHAVAIACHANGTWRQEFAGKEILRDVAGRICDRTAIPKFPSSDVEFYSDLAKEVAGWQVANNAAPADLIDLLAALKVRIARPAPGP